MSANNGRSQNLIMLMSASWKYEFFFVAIGLFGHVPDVSASPWPIDVSVAYIEELQLVCAEAHPDAKAKFEARKQFLYSESQDRVNEAKASKTFSQARVWARDVLKNSNGADVAEQCSSFLTNSNLALKQDDSRNDQPVPVSR